MVVEQKTNNSLSHRQILPLQLKAPELSKFAAFYAISRVYCYRQENVAKVPVAENLVECPCLDWMCHFPLCSTVCCPIHGVNLFAIQLFLLSRSL
ncbi:hypothetical protein TNCT_243221 [Trichonephila clavata]|uniref:Uncharacterized protein n=1 Tax=Trichonephila clavata TaxID=2740835 RepID=A0A8X6KLS7_TRICU|nr:hypothetical protein TNCT_243221 [Trichonephila clavata]